MLKLCNRLYCNLWFLVKKKNSRYRFINSAINVNAVTIRDIIIPPNINKFAEDVASYPLILLVDILFRYNEITLYRES